MSIKNWPGGRISPTPPTPSGPYENSTASGVWTLDQVAYWRQQNLWPLAGNPATDPNFEYVTMLLPGNGTNGAQNNTFLDSSTNNFTITRNGNTTQGTFTPYGSNWSNYFDGTGDYLTTTLSSAVTSTYTIDFWINTNTVAAGDGCILNIHTTAGNTNGLVIKRNGSQIQVNDGATAGTGPSGGSLSVGTWTFVTLVCNGTNTILYINGSSVATYSGVSLSGSPTFVHIGNFGDLVGGAFAGYISNVRVVVGSANTPSSGAPTSPSTAITNTKLLTCQSNRFIDNSSNNFTITRNGDVSVQRFSPFNPTTPYAAGTIGGSGYFDGSGDYLTTPNTGQFAPTGDFTIAFWWYPPSLVATGDIIGNYTANTTSDWVIEAQNGDLYFYYSGASYVIYAASALKAGQWHFITASRSGSTLDLRVNGASAGTATYGSAFGSASKSIYMGARSGTYPAIGYMSDVRFINGSSVTTVPTAPLTAITNTSLLLNFTNGGIIDNAMMNDLETVGNAQISTSVSKFGGGSLAFDGTGDWLLSQSSPQNALGSVFTVECWVYINASGVIHWLCGNNTGSGNTAFLLEIEADRTVYGGGWTNGTQTTATVALSTWTHIAFVGDGTNYKIYLNGTQSGTAGAVNNLTSTLPIYVGAKPDGTRNLNGYIDDLRITKGYARYTANFTPPAAPFPIY